MYLTNVLLENFLIKMVLSLLIVHSLVKCDKNNEQRFQFPEFDYKETNKNELSYREFESACEQSSQCKELQPNGIQRHRCIMECISPSCYQDIYRFDELEEGEIDVRLVSFKGCFVQRLGRSRNR
ncbi:uncharacterized protein LOC119081505 [Bradysia coprophila]|uniref:uncharacterized protein LOC119081505 n=1 Tax=Bradysia coprophila TaxID=38358 RepID=UPI00187D8EAE|nr:uncharacterized protein LOC119081505 [Bradysia coprophila]